MQDDAARQGTASAAEKVTAGPTTALHGIVARLTGYRETVWRKSRHTQAASLTVPLIISFGDPFEIGLGRAPTASDQKGSFAAGLFAGPVVIDSFGNSHCLQIDFTPLGARRFFRVPMHELAGRMVELDAILGADGKALRERLGNEIDWSSRFSLATRFVEQRIASSPVPAPEIARAFDEMSRCGGTRPVATLARSAGWSRKHFANRFADELGIGPKAISRIVRINRAIERARVSADGWADIAADCGFSDQAHLAREFRDLAGATPVSWRGGITSP